MTNTEHSPAEQDSLRLPRVAVLAGRFVAGLEAADSTRPISINTAGDARQNFQECLTDELARADAVYDRHEELFYPNGEITLLDDLDLTAILDNTVATLEIVEPVVERIRGLTLGLGIAQLGEMALAIKEQPNLLAALTADTSHLRHIVARPNVRELSAERRDMTAILAQHNHDVIENIFQTNLAPHIRGDLDQVPFYKQSYSGYPLDLYYRFWEQYVAVRTPTPDLQTKLDKIIHRFPDKTARFDGHTAIGRPSPAVMRPYHVHKLQLFEDSLQVPAPHGFNASGNFSDALKAIISVVDASLADGYSQDESFRIVARHCNTIGKLTERSGTDLPYASSLRLEGSRQNPALSIGHPTDTIVMSDKARRRRQKGGICPARNVVITPTGGRAHRGAEVVSEMLQERTGILPSFAWKIEDIVYLDPAAFIIGVSLLSIIENS